MPVTAPWPTGRPVLRAPSAQPRRRRVPPPVEYPESDGKPMAETPIHWLATVDFGRPLLARYAGRGNVYVGSDMLMFYQEGNPRRAVSPDVFVAFGPDQEPLRRVWRVWEEGTAADFVLEVTSKQTRAKDEGFKAKLYERLGVKEYWQFDPTEDYLSPPLKRRRLGPDGAYEAIRLEQGDGGLSGWSAVLGLKLRVDGKRLRLFDPELDDFLPNQDEAEAKLEKAEAERDQAEAERDQAEAERDAAAARIAELERQLGLR